MSRPRRVLLLNALLGLGITGFAWVGSHVRWDPRERGRDARFGPQWDGSGPSPWPQQEVVWPEPAWWGLPFLVLLAGSVALRWWRPRLAYVASAVAVGGFFAAAGFLGPVLVALSLTVYPMAVTLAPRRWVPLLALLVPVVLAAHRTEPSLGLLDPVLYAELVMAVAFAVVPALVALLRRSRREVSARDREEDRRRTAYEERLRIAREIHDVVGHSLSVVTMQAGVALHVLDKQPAAQAPAQVRASLEAIRRTSREALAELRTTLGTFRAEYGEPRAPVAGLDRLADLVAALRTAGRRIDVVRVPGDGAPALPVAVDQAAFRIVQESLTNVVRHTGDAAATVRVETTPTALLIEVADDGPPVPGFEEGTGIRGMRERAQALGGTLALGPGPTGGLVVRASLPLVTLADPVAVP